MNWLGVGSGSLLALHPAAESHLVNLPDLGGAGQRLAVGDDDAPIGWRPPWQPDSDGIVTISIAGLLLPRGMYYGSGYATSYDAIIAILDRAEARADVVGVVLDINSPGGAAAGCFTAAARIRGSPLPIAAVAAPFAYSGAYALASAAGRIFAQDDSGLGSIGVINVHMDISDAMKRAGIVPTVFRAGDRKARPTPLEPLTDQDRAEVSADIEAVNQQFIAMVAAHRSLPPATVAGLEARGLIGSAALAAGLSDERGGMAEARAWVIAAATERGTKMSNPGMTGDGKSLSDRLAAQMAAARDQGYAAGVAAERQRIGGIASVCALSGQMGNLAGYIASDVTLEAAAADLQRSRADHQGQGIDIHQPGDGQGQIGKPQLKPMSQYIEEMVGGKHA